MATRQKRHSKIAALIVPAIVAGAIGYFGYHAYHGEYGLVARYDMDVRIADLTKERDAIVAERERLSARVAQMRLETLDADMLDERVRASLNVVHPNDIMIMKNAQ